MENAPLIIAISTVFTLSACGAPITDSNVEDDATASSIAAYVDSSKHLANEYNTSTCGPLKIRYFSSKSMPRAALDIQAPDAYNYVWFGTATMESGNASSIREIEFLYSDGTNSPSFTGRQVGKDGKTITLPSPIFVEVPSSDLHQYWTKLDITRIQAGAPFTFSPLGGIVSPRAENGRFEFRPTKPHVFRINGTQTCEVMPAYATVNITP